MSVYGGPKLTTSGLVLLLDPADTKSYVSGSTTWYDRTNQYNASSYGDNDRFFFTGNRGHFDYTNAWTGHANAATGWGFVANMIPVSGNFALGVWVSMTGNKNQSTILSNAGGADGVRFGQQGDKIYFLIGPDYTEGGIGAGYSLNDGVWHYALMNFDRRSQLGSVPSGHIYIDGRYMGGAAFPSNQTAMTNSVPGLIKNVCCYSYQGKLGQFQVYDRVLSEREVAANYASQKSRFGR